MHRINLHTLTIKDLATIIYVIAESEVKGYDMDYVTVQIEKETWDLIQLIRKEVKNAIH